MPKKINHIRSSRATVRRTRFFGSSATSSGVKIGTRAPLVKNLLIVEGITRAGKFLLANLVHGFKGIEQIQYYGLPENLPFLEKFGFVDHKTAKEILQCQIDTHCYEMLIGRNLNYRRSDKSSIFNNPRYKEFIARANEENRQKELNEFYKNKNYSFFIMHELMPNINIYFETFPTMKVIHIQRGPIDLVYSWYKRGLGKRWGNDPTWFQITFGDKFGPIPWYAHNWTGEYRKLSEVDRVIRSIQELLGLYKKSYAGLSAKQKKQILFIRYEEILEKPLQVIKKLKKFLHKDPLPDIRSIIKKEGLPNKENTSSKIKKIEEIRKIASDKFFSILLKLEREYAKKN